MNLYHSIVTEAQGTQMHFQDTRPPHEVQFQLERDVLTLFRPEFTAGRLVFKGFTNSSAVPYHLELRFNAALPKVNLYTLRLTYPAGQRDSAASWFRFWTRDFKSTYPPDPNVGSADLYRTRAEQAISVESHLTDIHAVQQEIVARMRKGGTYSTSHKEGGTNISLRGSKFLRADYGEWEQTETFTEEAKFFSFLRKFYDWQTQSASSEFDKWKLILRLLRPS
jgi:hypothetical protein